MKPDWKPIETAPKNGERIIAWSTEWSGPLAVSFAGKLGWICHCDHTLKHQPTHWTELPDPPPTDDWYWCKICKGWHSLAEEHDPAKATCSLRKGDKFPRVTIYCPQCDGCIECEIEPGRFEGPKKLPCICKGIPEAT